MWTLQPYKGGRSGRQGFTVSHRHNGEVKTSTVRVCKTDWVAGISHPHRPLPPLDLPLLHPLDFVFSFPLVAGLQREAKREAQFSLVRTASELALRAAGEQAQARPAPFRSRDPPCPAPRSTQESQDWHEALTVSYCPPNTPCFNGPFLVEHP